jgi:RimJ/RimL family protein N-acetyltransferase
MPSFPDLPVPLSADRVTVRFYEERDIPEILIAYQDDPRLHVVLGHERPPSGAQLGRLCEEQPGERRSGTHAVLSILESGSDVCRGQINVHHVDWENARTDLGVWLAPQVRGRGLGSAALALVATWLLRQVGLERVQIKTEPDNDPMMHAAQAAGFVTEGVLRSYGREHGTRIDLAIMSFVRSDLEKR